MTAVFSLTLAMIALWHIYRLDKLSREHEARLATLEQRKPEPEKRVTASVDWNKPIEGFEPEIPTKVLPRSKEEKRARVRTDWEINSDFKIIG